VSFCAFSAAGYRTDPFTKARKMHEGMDFTAKIGTPIYATGDLSKRKLTIGLLLGIISLLGTVMDTKRYMDI
jgi:hypothetical protein